MLRWLPGTQLSCCVMNTLSSHLLVSTRALLVSAFGPWVEMQAQGLALRACPQGHLWSDTPQGRPWAHPPGGGLGREHSRFSAGTACKSATQGGFSLQTSGWTRRGEARLLHCLKAELKNQKLYRALKLQVTGSIQPDGGSLH